MEHHPQSRLRQGARKEKKGSGHTDNEKIATKRGKGSRRDRCSRRGRKEKDSNAATLPSKASRKEKEGGKSDPDHKTSREKGKDKQRGNATLNKARR